MCFGTHLNQLSIIGIYTGEQEIGRVDQSKYLGLIIDQHLSFLQDAICNIEILRTHRDRHVGQKMYQETHNLAPEGLQNMFEFVREAHERRTKSNLAEHLYLPRCKLEFSKRNFKYRRVKNWNPLTLQLRNASSYAVFKKECFSFYSDGPGRPYCYVYIHVTLFFEFCLSLIHSKTN